MENDERTCRNCKYYREHYVKINLRYSPLRDGHCVNRILSEKNKYRRDRYRLYENCEYWESDEGKKEERKREIEEYIALIAERLDEIAAILKEDVSSTKE